jgi:DNA-binding NarL/FixJ family response regulator
MAKNIRILIVEDEVISAMYLQIQLKKMNYDICKKVVTGEDAIRIALKEKPDVILIDIRLAGKMDGIKTIKEINAFYKPLVIFMTGFQDEELFDKARVERPAGILTKPFEVEEIKKIIDSALKN